MDVDDLQVLRAQVAHHRYLVSFGGGEPRGSEYTSIKALMLAVLETAWRATWAQPVTAATKRRSG